MLMLMVMLAIRVVARGCESLRNGFGSSRMAFRKVPGWARRLLHRRRELPDHVRKLPSRTGSAWTRCDSSQRSTRRAPGLDPRVPGHGQLQVDCHSKYKRHLLAVLQSWTARTTVFFDASDWRRCGSPGRSSTMRRMPFSENGPPIGDKMPSASSCECTHL